MKAALLLVLLSGCYAALAQKGIAQTDTTKSAYGRLVTRKVYTGTFQQERLPGGTSIYKVNGKEVDKTVFDHYHDNQNNVEQCTPCILEIYGLDEKPIHKGIQFMDLPVGFWIEYFPTGKVKIVGHYKENDTGIQRNFFKKGFGERDGIWTYFNEAGRRLYSEYWKDGKFISQIPEQKKPEVWTVQLLYNGHTADRQTFTPQQFNELQLVPKYKNSAITGVAITGEFEISATGYCLVKQKFSLADFAKIDVQQMILKSGIPANKTASGILRIFVEGANTVNYFITIKK
ncbi:MAG: toxin-antitoxin system YwqK family antitoxin [Janthinobacterium lividum]